VSDEEEDDATIQMDVSSIQAMFKSNQAAAQGPPADGTAQLDRAEIDALVARERERQSDGAPPVKRSTMIGYAVGANRPPAAGDAIEDGTTQIGRDEIEALLDNDTAPNPTVPAHMHTPSQGPAAPPSPGPKADPTQMVDRRALEMLQSRDEEHALAAQFEQGGFAGFDSEPQEDDVVDVPSSPTPTLEDLPPVGPLDLEMEYGATIPTGFDSPFSRGAASSLPEAPDMSGASPMTMPSSIPSDIAPAISRPPTVNSGLDADSLFDDIGPMTPMAPLNPLELSAPSEPTEDIATSGLGVPERPTKKTSSALPYIVGALIVFALASVGLAVYIVFLAG
jgi:hypothetical protein